MDIKVINQDEATKARRLLEEAFADEHHERLAALYASKNWRGLLDYIHEIAKQSPNRSQFSARVCNGVYNIAIDYIERQRVVVR